MAEFSPTPAKTKDGRDFIPVREDEEKAIAPAPSAKPNSEAASADRKILYYRNPMGLPDTSPTPKKDWMGMDYIPVYEGEDQGGSSVTVSLDKVQRSGVRTEEARMVKLARPVRAPAIAKPDERTMRIVSLRADAFIEKLYVNETGKHVVAGEPLFRIYSPQMVTAQVNYQVAARDRAPMGTQGRRAAAAEPRTCHPLCWRRCAAKASPSCRSIGRLRSRAWSWRNASSRARWRAWVMCCSASPIWPISGSSPMCPSRISPP